MAESSSHSRASRWSRIALRVLAIVFAAVTVLYTWFWMVAVQLEQPPAVELGLGFPYQPSLHANVVTNVKSGSPAENAGLRVGDHVVAFDGRPVADAMDQVGIWRLRAPGDSVRLTILRPGESAALEMTAVFHRNSDLDAAPGGLQGALRRFLRNSLPLAFAAVGLIILLLRPQDRNVWLLACFFAGIIASVGFPGDFRSAPALLRPWFELYNGIFLGAIGASFFFLCAVFPARSPIDRRLPWLKWAGLVLGLVNAGEMSRPGISRPLPTLSRLIAPQAADRFNFDVALAFLALGLVSLAANFLFAGQPESRRKIRVIFWGTVVGIGPSLIRAGLEQYTAFRAPGWLDMILNGALLLVPASFAYAVFKQRVLDIPVLLRRSARYVLVQRGFLILLCFVSFGLTLLFAASLARLPLEIAMSRSASTALGALFGTALLWGGSRVHTRVSGSIDRAFFRNAYDARVILENLAETSRTAPDREALAHLLLNQLTAALQPASLVVYLTIGHDELGAAAGVAPPHLQTIRSGAATVLLTPIFSGCLVPVLGRDARMVGLLALGPRLSEEPYSGEDQRLLASVASQAGMALENFRLARDIAEKLEAERRTAREMEIAREVQTRLLPQTAPMLSTLECAGRCLQAARVGGDYFDFLELGRDKLGLVLADVSGKGVHAALLVANLQAHLRSLGPLMRGAAGLVETLRQVNRILWKSTAPEHYATLFVGLYDDSTRHLTYVNCGHNPPLLLRAGGSVDRLEATATVVGLFESWECEAREIQLHSADLLAISSDGVTEAMLGEEEFGESRFLDQLRRARRLPLQQVVTAVFTAVEQFSAGNQSDDLTLVVARCRPACDR